MKSTHYRGTKEEVKALSAFVKLTRASEAISTRVHQHLGEAGLTVSQFGVLEAIYHIGPLSQAELAKKILKSTGNITMVIDNLERRGLVKRERKEGDRRYYAVTLTPAGQKLISGIFPRHAGKIVESMNVLTKAEQEKLGQLCRKLGLVEEEAGTPR
ncbi:MAG: MarR family transcriptional regulator [Nitrospiraceae bacterium]|nr:MarR family transcriptional regulator [Nitrospiraceae bacterium]